VISFGCGYAALWLNFGNNFKWKRGPKMQMRFIQTDAGKIAYLAGGQGKNLILLLSLPRKRESRIPRKDWIPASAGMTS